MLRRARFLPVPVVEHTFLRELVWSGTYVEAHGRMSSQSPHVVLLGDSIFDNAAYTDGEPDVVTHLQGLLPDGWRATLAAVDGATTAGLAGQLRRVPDHATHLVISVGGNDALQNIDLLSMRITSSVQAFHVFAERLAGFEHSYRAAIREALALGRSTSICTIYNGALDEDIKTAARLALTLFNDVILRTAAERHLDVLELRTVCTEAADYANPIEPSGRGGLKIARGIAHMIGALPTERAPGRLWSMTSP